MRSQHLFVVAVAAQLATISAQASVQISADPTQNMNCADGVCTPTAADAVLNVSDLAALLVSGDVMVNTEGNLAQDIELNAPLHWTSTSRLTLDAYHSIAFNRSMTVTGTGALTITTNDGGSGGDYRFFGNSHVKFSKTESQLQINGDAYMLVRSIGQLKNDIELNDRGHYALAKSIITDRAYGYSPIRSKTFYGVFEGLGNTITNFTIWHDGALFQRLCYAGERSCVIRDLGMIAANIHGGGYSAPLVVDNQGTIENCFATGQVSVSGQGIAGGLVSDSIGVIKNSYSDVAVSGVTAGGIAGVLETFCNGDLCESTALIIGSYSLGPVSGYYAGGLVGDSADAAIVNSYASGKVINSSGGDSGGLVGLYTAIDHPEHSALTTSYSTGQVTGGTFVGGFVGKDEVEANVTNNYWDFNTSGVRDPGQGAGNIPNDPGITGLKDKRLKSGLPVGFDPAIWGQKKSINNGYPYLLANPPPQ